MAVNTKVIKRRLKSIGSTKKITKAMEMISAVKMRRAVSNVLATRSYATLAWEMLTEIAGATNISLHPLLAERPVKKVGLLLITSNRGLAGGFNSKILQQAHDFIVAEAGAGVAVDVILVGKKGRKIYQRYGHTVAAEFDKLDLTIKVAEILPLLRLIINDYTRGAYDKIMLAYTDFVSALTQRPRLKQLLPIVEINARPLVLFSDNKTAQLGDAESDSHFLFEPDTRAVLDVLLPRLVEAQVYQAILESDASEHSARMLAMRNASDAAEDIISELTQSFNKARQSAITQEISEIVGGAASLG